MNKLDDDPMLLLNIIDERTPEQLKADGDHRWPDGTLYTPPHLVDKVRTDFIRGQLELEAKV